MGFLKPKKSKSDNANLGLINSTFTGQAQQGVQANNILSALLTGQGNVGRAQGALQGFLGNAGFAPAMRQLSQNITGQGAASGLLRSGATTQRLQQSGAELNNQFFNNFLQNLSGLSSSGLQAGGLLANAGSRSVGGGPSTLGSIASLAGGISATPLGGAIGKGISKIFSDRRLKRDIEKIGEAPDGLGIYEYRYVLNKQRYQGVMADEVASLRPWALGPVVKGYATVDYGRL